MAFISPKGDPTRKLFLPLPEGEQILYVFERAHQIMAEHEPSLTRKQRIFYTPGNPFCFLQFSTPENCTKVFNLIAGSFRVQRPRDYVEPKIEAPKIEIPKITENSFPSIGGSIGGEILLAGGSAAPSSVRLLGTVWGSKKLVKDLHEAKNAEEANIAAWEAYDRACALAAEEEKKRQKAIEWAAGAPARKEAARLAAIEEEAERARLEIVRAEKTAKARAKEERRLVATSAEATAAAEKAEKEMYIVNAKNYLWYKSLTNEERAAIRQSHFSEVTLWAIGFNYVRQNGIQI
jgi:hypothetical protein